MSRRKRHILARLWAWLQAPDPREHYLTAASDLADLERRLRLTERANAHAVFVTFNH